MPSNTVFVNDENISKNTIIFEILSDIALQRVIYVTNDNLSKFAEDINVPINEMQKANQLNSLQELTQVVPPHTPNFIKSLQNFFNKISNYGIDIIDAGAKINSVYENKFGEQLYLAFSQEEILKIDKLISTVLCIIKNNTVDKMLDRTIVFNKYWLCPKSWGLYDVNEFSDQVNKILANNNIYINDDIKIRETIGLLSTFYNKALMNHDKILNVHTNKLKIPMNIKKYIKRIISQDSKFTKCFNIFNGLFNRLSPNYQHIVQNTYDDLYKIIFITMWDIKLRGINVQKFASDDSVITGIISAINGNYCNVIANSTK
jgi:hypothetical protein